MSLLKQLTDLIAQIEELPAHAKQLLHDHLGDSAKAPAKRKAGRPPGAPSKVVVRSARKPMSAAARARVSKALKARWRAAKKSGKTRLG